MANQLVTLRHEDGAHFYHRDGTPCHEVPNKSRGGMRPTTITDARKLDLVPSVTSVLRVLAKPGIEQWNLRMHLEEALTHPTGDPADVIQRVADAKAVAPDLGSAYHRDLAQAMREWPGPFSKPETMPQETLDAVLSWCSVHSLVVGCVESPFASALGYGGCLDLGGTWFRDDDRRLVLIDWKTTDTDEKRAPKAWPEHAYQLAAYSMGRSSNLDATDLVNVIISRTEPGRIEAHIWNLEEKRDAWEVFRCALRIWQITKRYDSSVGGRG